MKLKNNQINSDDTTKELKPELYQKDKSLKDVNTSESQLIQNQKQVYLMKNLKTKV